MELGLSILAFIVVIGPLIFFHELGHFIGARLNDIEVEEFGIGYPPRMLTLFERNGTKYTLNWLPLGGFMRPKGEEDPDVPGGFADASKGARFTVLVAGPGANFVVAFILLAGMFMIGAPVEQPGVEVIEVVANSPAQEAGLQEGDVILSADDEAIQGTTSLIAYVNENAGNPITLTILRGGEQLTTDIVPRVDPPEGEGPTGIRIDSRFTVEQFGPFAAIGQAAQEIGDMLWAFVTLPRLIIEQTLPARYLRPVSVVGIADLGGQTIESSIEQNALWPIVNLTAYISVALAVTNLLPIPALDGGRILFIIIEAIRGRRIDPEKEMVIHFIGFAILIALMFVFVYLDLTDPLF